MKTSVLVERKSFIPLLNRMMLELLVVWCFPLDPKVGNQEIDV